MRQLQGMDTSFVALETPNSPMHIGSILLFDPATAPGGFVRFGVNIIPHTAAQTTFADAAAGRSVNIEIDILARYIGRLLETRASVM